MDANDTDTRPTRIAAENVYDGPRKLMDNFPGYTGLAGYEVINALVNCF